MSFLSKMELKKQLNSLGIKVVGNYVRKVEIEKALGAKDEYIVVLDNSAEKITYHKNKCSQFANQSLKLSKEIRSLLSDNYTSDLMLDEHNQNLLSRASALLETIYNLRSTYIDAVNDKGGRKTVEKIPKFILNR